MTGDLFADILIEGTLSEGPVVANDYTLGVEEIEGGHRLVVQHGGQSQHADIMDGEDATIDATLTQAGQAADAKAAGDALDGVRADLPFVAVIDMSERIPSVEPFENVKAAFDAGRAVFAMVYWPGESAKLYVCTGVTASQARFTCTSSNEIRGLTLNADQSIGGTATPVPYVDATLTESGAAADAAATGQRFDEAEDIVNRKVGRLFRLTKGQAWDAEADTAEAYAKTVPTGAHAAAVEMIGGKTVVLNQLVNVPEIQTTIHGVGFVCGDGLITANGTASSNADKAISGSGTVYHIKSGHKYLLTGCPQGGGEGTYKLYGSSSLAFPSGNVFNDFGSGSVKTAAADEEVPYNNTFYVRIAGGATVNGLVFRPQLFDLTLMFGAAAADTVTTAKQAYALGVPREVVPYNTGELKNAVVDAVIVTDENGDEISRMEIPDAVRALAGYGLSAGAACNSIEYSADTDEWSFVKRVNSRAYQSGDESDPACVTDGTTTCFAAGTTVTTDITQTMPAYDLLDCEAGGAVTYHQTDGSVNLAVPNNMTYFINLSEAMENE